MEKLFAEQREHPGVAHYIIHAYDYPPLAERALDASRRYAKIAPDSAASAVKNNSPGNELHAKDYLIYAYLQRAQDHEAKEALQSPPPGRPDYPQYMNWLYEIGRAHV